ncbi:MAG: cyclic nucleotide-binding domain-containing protein [Candidatus Schekmanbacteria bacterium]|nr:cyclic nucleotide-binding domain-containing protein [Candidatus Schekmanbacteria bacterium]
MGMTKYLASLPLFEGLSKRELREIEAIIHQRNFKDMEVISQAGELPLAIYVIKKGQVNLVIGKPGEVGDIIETLVSGDVVGEICLFDDEPRFTSIISIGDTETYGMFKYDIEELMRRNEKLGFKIVRNIGKKLASRVRKLSHLVYERTGGSGADE